MTTAIDRRLDALEKQAAGSAGEQLCLIVTFEGSEESATGLDRMGGSNRSIPSIDRLPGEEWEALKERARKAVEHLPVAVYIARLPSKSDGA